MSEIRSGSNPNRGRTSVTASPNERGPTRSSNPFPQAGLPIGSRRDIVATLREIYKLVKLLNDLVVTLGKGIQNAPPEVFREQDPGVRTTLRKTPDSEKYPGDEI